MDELMQQYLVENPDWSELHEAFQGWQIPENVQFIRNVWGEISHPFAAEGFSHLPN
ncbi:hypothetical protein HGO21_03460 [Acinetobacter sp. CUI P1]|nr:hypothetical protein [Acinetobacter sp. CUI P1]